MAKKSTRILSFILSVLLLISMLSSMAFAQYDFSKVESTKATYSIVYDSLVGVKNQDDPSVFIVDSDWAYEEGKGPKTVTFTFRDQVITENYNENRHFESVAKVQKYIEKKDIKPATIILTEGIYAFNYASRKSVIFLGPKAGMDPNVRDSDPTKEWLLSEDRFLPAEDSTETKGEAIMRPGSDDKMFRIDNDGNQNADMVIDGLVLQGRGAGAGDETYRNGGSRHRIYVQNCILDNCHAPAGRSGGAAFSFDMRNSQEHEKHLYFSNDYIINQSGATTANNYTTYHPLYSGHANVVEMNGCSYQRASCQPFNSIYTIQWQGQKTRVTNSHFWNPEGKTVVSGTDTGYFFNAPWNNWTSNSKGGNDEVEFSATIINNTFYNMGSPSRPMFRVGMAGNSFFKVEDNTFIDTENHASHDVFKIEYISSGGKISHVGIGGGGVNAEGKDTTGTLLEEGNYFMDNGRVAIHNNTFIGSEYMNIPNIGKNTHPDTDVQMTGNLYLDNPDSTEGKIIQPQTEDSKIYNQWVWLDAAMTKKSSEIFNADVSIQCKGEEMPGEYYNREMDLDSKEYTLDFSVETNENNGVRVYKSDASWIKGNQVQGTDGAFTVDTSARVNYYIVSVTSIDGRTEQDIKVTLNRAANEDAALLDIIPEEGTDLLEKVATETGFDLKVGYFENTLSFKLSLPEGATAAVRQGTSLVLPKSGVYTTKELPVGETIELSVTVTGADKLKEVYTVTVRREYNDETALVSVDCTDADAITSSGNTFTIKVPATVKATSISVEISEKATVAMKENVYGSTLENVNNTFYLKEILAGENVYTVNVLAQNGIDYEEWTIIVFREKRTDCEILGVADAEKVGNMYVAFTPNENFTVSVQVSEGATYFLYTDSACTEALDSPYLTLTEATTVLWIVAVAEDDTFKSEPVKLIINTYDDPENNEDHPVNLEMADDGILAVSGGHFDPEGGLVVVPLDPETKQVNFIVQGYSDYTVRLYSDNGPKPMKLANKSTLTLDAGRTILYATATIDADPDAEIIEYAIYILAPRQYKYTDKSFTGYAKEYIMDIAENGWGLMKGDSLGKFNGTKNITRYEVATLMVRVVGANVNLYENAKNPFADVQEGHWATNYVKAAYRMSMIEGVEQGAALLFNGDNNASRSEFFKIFLSAFVYDVDEYYAENQEIIDESIAAMNLKDLEEIPEWAKSSVYTIAALGLVKGSDAAKILPNKTITRDEVAVILGRGSDFLETDPEFWFDLV